MIVALCIIITILGMIMMIFDIFIPLEIVITMLPVIYTFKFMGFGISAIGLLILGARIYQTTIGPFLEIPNTKRVILMHQRRGKNNPNTFFITARLDDLEYIRARNKIFKDTGGGFRIAGHDVRRTHELINFDIPEWMSDYFYQLKKEWNTNDGIEFKTLTNQLRELKPSIPGNTLEDQLWKIPMLKPIMENPTYRQYILDMKLRDIQNLSLLCCDGKVHHSEEVEEFIDSATPNELSVLEKQKFLNEKMEEKHYREVGEHNIGQWIGPILLLMVGGAIAAAILYGTFGG